MWFWFTYGHDIRNIAKVSWVGVIFMLGANHKNPVTELISSNKIISRAVS